MPYVPVVTLLALLPCCTFCAQLHSTAPRANTESGWLAPGCARAHACTHARLWQSWHFCFCHRRAYCNKAKLQIFVAWLEPAKQKSVACGPLHNLGGQSRHWPLGLNHRIGFLCHHYTTSVGAGQVLSFFGFEFCDVMLGHSMGTAVAFETCLLFPTKAPAIIPTQPNHPLCVAQR